MTDLYRRIETMWWHGEPSLPLRMLSKLYAQASRIDLRRRARQPIPASLPLISIGNITVGGSGKTPFVIWLAAALKQRGFIPVILCRGDGSSRAKGSSPSVVEDTDSADEVGDEAVMLHQLSGCTVISGHNRLASAAVADQYGDIILLDDGFQYRQLERTCDVVLLPAAGVGNGAMLPAGPLREPLAALKRADFLVQTGNESLITIVETTANIQRQWQWKTDEQPVQIAGNSCTLPTQMVAACAIARPDRFMNSLRAAGILIRNSLHYPDHYRFTVRQVKKIQSYGLPVIVTAKDAVKLKPLWHTTLPLWIMKQSGNGEEGLIDAIITHTLGHQTYEKRSREVTDD